MSATTIAPPRNTDLWIATMIAVIAIVGTVLELPPVARLPFAVPFVLFIPGYCLVALLFPVSGNIDALERIGLSFGLSMALIAPIALGIDLLPWGVTTATILFGLGATVFAFALFATVRRRRIPPDRRFTVRFRTGSIRVPRLGPLSSRQSAAVIAVVLIAGGIGAAQAIENQLRSSPFTEFSMLTTQGTARSYPRDLIAGESAAVTLSIANHEQTTRDYVVVVAGDAVGTSGPVTVTLQAGESWSEVIEFNVPEPNEAAIVRFELRRAGIDQEADAPYRTLELVITSRNATPVAMIDVVVALVGIRI